MEGASILVIGGGKVAEQKVTGLLDTGASVTVIAPGLTKNLEALWMDQKISVHKRNYQVGDVREYTLVFAATNNPDVHREIFDEAVSLNIPVNVVDVPDLCNFYLASVFQKGDLKVAVSTNGKSPTLGKIIRDRIGKEFGVGYPELLSTLGDIRPFVHSAFSASDKRKEVLEKIVDEELKKQQKFPSGKFNCDQKVSLRQTGKVILVGAGPGDPDLITVKGLRALQHADVIVYDALVSKDLLGKAKSGCELIYVGKRSGQHSAAQDEINLILLMKANEGKSVARLKGGDPFVFGRGVEEVQFLQTHGIEVDIIPGITAGTGIPSALGIPLTHRGISSSVVFLTGTDHFDKSSSADWNSIANIETVIIYMGIRNLTQIIEGLTNAGRSVDTPAAVVFDGTNEGEIVVEGTLRTIVGRTLQVQSAAPGIVIIGDVVRFLQGRATAGPLQFQFA